MMAPVKELVLFLMIDFRAVFGDKHSLLYLYTMQSKNSYSNIYDCTAVTLLNGRQIDFYNSSTDKPRTPNQNWPKNVPQSDWIISTEKLQYDTLLLNRLINTQMNEFRHSQSGVHVLQWRHGCEVEQSSDGSLTVLNSINEFGYDGEDLIQFNCISKTWITPEKKKNREMEETWSKIFNADKKCDQCEEMLKMFLQYKTTEQYRTTDIAGSHTPPAVNIFAKKSVRDSSKLILICLITGFYPKDVEMSLRKFSTEIPEYLITSSGIRPNDDETYQLRKTVEIQEEDKAYYYCHVSPRNITKEMIIRWDERSRVGLVLVLIPCFVILVVLMMIIKLQHALSSGHHSQLDIGAEKRETGLRKKHEQISFSGARKEDLWKKHEQIPFYDVEYTDKSPPLSIDDTDPDKCTPFNNVESDPDEFIPFSNTDSDPDEFIPFSSAESDPDEFIPFSSAESVGEMHY